MIHRAMLVDQCVYKTSAQCPCPHFLVGNPQLIATSEMTVESTNQLPLWINVHWSPIHPSMVRGRTHGGPGIRYGDRTRDGNDWGIQHSFYIYWTPSFSCISKPCWSPSCKWNLKWSCFGACPSSSGGHFFQPQHRHGKACSASGQRCRLIRCVWVGRWVSLFPRCDSLTETSMFSTQKIDGWDLQLFPFGAISAYFQWLRC